MVRVVLNTLIFRIFRGDSFLAVFMKNMDEHLGDNIQERKNGKVLD